MIAFFNNYWPVLFVVACVVIVAIDALVYSYLDKEKTC